MSVRDTAALIGVSLKTGYNLRDRAIIKLTDLSQDCRRRPLLRLNDEIIAQLEEVQGRMTKVPCNAKTGRKASSTDPTTWASFDVALQALRSGGYSGLGIGISGDIAAIDIDHCIDKYGHLTDMAQDIVDRMDSYTETSPSGTGIRIIFTAPDFQYDKHYLILYRIRDDTVFVDYVVDCRQDYGWLMNS